MTASNVAATQAVVNAFLDAHFPWLPKPKIIEWDNIAGGSTYYTGNAGSTISVPKYSDAWNDGRLDIDIHECGHVLAFYVASLGPDPLVAFLREFGASDALLGDRSKLNEIFAEHFVRAYLPSYDGHNRPELVGLVPFDAAKMRAFCESLQNVGKPATNVVAPTGSNPTQITQSVVVSAPTAAPVAFAIEDIRADLARADWEIGRSTVRIGTAFHHTGSPDLDTTDPVRALQVLARYHRMKNWAAPGQPPAYGDGLMYTFAIGSGRTFQCRDIDAVLYATASDGNRTHYHCLFLSDPPSAEDYAQARSLIEHLGVPPTTHRAFGTSTCPGDVIAAWVENYGVGDNMVSREEFTAYKGDVLQSFTAHVEAIGKLSDRIKALESDDTADDTTVVTLRAELDKMRAALHTA